MKSNEDYLKQLYCDVLLKSMSGALIGDAIKDAKKAINSFSEQFESKEILKPLDDKYIKVWNLTQEEEVLNSIVRMRKYRFKGCSLDYSMQKIPSVELGKFPYWLQVYDNGTIQIITKKPE